MKKQISKRILSFMLTLLMVVGLLPLQGITAKAANKDNGFTMEITDFKANNAVVKNYRVDYHSMYIFEPDVMSALGVYKYNYKCIVFNNENDDLNLYLNGNSNGDYRGSFTWQDCTKAANIEQIHKKTVTYSHNSTVKNFEWKTTFSKNAYSSHDLVTITTKEPTCTAKGEQKTVCKRCTYVKSTETLPIDSDAHPYTYTNIGNDKHKGVCPNNSSHTTVEESCSGGTATCSAQAECEKCGTSYGDTKPHTWTEWKYDADAFVNITHYRTCTVCNPNGNTWADVGSEHEIHSYSGATCVKKPTCKCGHTSGNYGTHSFTQKKNGDTIEQTCAHSSAHNSTIALAEDSTISTVYTGKEIKPLKATITGFQYIYPQVVYTDNVNVGTAKGTISVGNVSIEKTFNITPADINDATVTFDPESGVYDGKAHNPAISVMWNGTKLQEGTDYTVGEWNGDMTTPDTFTGKITGSGNFVNTKLIQYTIGKATPTADLFKVTLPQNPVYDGEMAYSATVTNAEGVEATGNFAVKYNGSTTAPTDAGTYQVTVDVEENSYYVAASDIVLGSFTIEKATVAEPNIENKVYIDSVQTADVPDSDLYTVSKNDGGMNVGEYEVVLTLVDSNNYKWTTTDDATVTLNYEITKATNEWTVEPDINGWTYGKTASTPNSKAEFGDVVVTYTGKTNGDKDYEASTTAPTEAGKYTATFTVTGNTNYTGLEKTVDFEISKSTYNMSNAKWDYANAFKYDGKEKTVKVIGLPDGVTVSNYTDNKATIVGDYIAKATLAYDDNNYNTPVVDDLSWKIENTWVPTEYSVSTPNGNGWLNDDFVITAADGYKLSTTNTADGTWSDTLTYADETSNGSVTFFMMNETDGTISLAKTVTYKIDKTPATGKVSIDERNSWESFLNSILINLFYKDEVTVKVEAEDTLSDLESIDYYALESIDLTALTLEQVQTITDWKAMPEDGIGVTVEDTKQFVYYIRITDKAGNVTYLSTDGAEYDISAPVITGVEEGKTYYTTQVVTVEDKNLATVTVNDEEVTLDNGTLTLEGNIDKGYKISATDKAGNTTIVTVTMKKIDIVKESIKDITENDVKSSDKETVQDVIDHVNELLNDEDVTADEKIALEDVKSDGEALINKIDDTATESKDLTDNVGTYDETKVTSDDKQTLTDLVADIDKLLNGENLTEDEKTALEEVKTDAEALIKKIDDTVTESKDITDKVGAYDETKITSDDKQTITDLVADIDKLLNGENLTEDEKTALEEVKTDAESLIKKIDDVAAADDTENTEKAKDITTETATPENKQVLEDAKADLEKALKDNDSNYTEAEKKVIQDEISRIGELIKVVEKIEYNQKIAAAEKDLGLAKAKIVKKKLKVTWTEVEGADGYDIYVQDCGKKFSKKNIVKTVKNGKLSVTIKKLHGKKITTLKHIKVRVRAYHIVDGKKVYLTKGIIVHVAKHNSKKYTNAKKIKGSVNSVTLTIGQTKKITAKVVKKNSKKKLLSTKHTSRLRYFTNNRKVATVTKKGKIKAVNSGTCTIYVVAQNGVRKKIKVTVK